MLTPYFSTYFLVFSLFFFPVKAATSKSIDPTLACTRYSPSIMPQVWKVPTFESGLGMIVQPCDHDHIHDMSCLTKQGYQQLFDKNFIAKESSKNLYIIDATGKSFYLLSKQEKECNLLQKRRNSFFLQKGWRSRVNLKIHIALSRIHAPYIKGSFIISPFPEIDEEEFQENSEQFFSSLPDRSLPSTASKQVIWKQSTRIEKRYRKVEGASETIITNDSIVVTCFDGTVVRPKIYQVTVHEIWMKRPQSRWHCISREAGSDAESNIAISKNNELVFMPKYYEYNPPPNPEFEIFIDFDYYLRGVLPANVIEILRSMTLTHGIVYKGQFKNAYIIDSFFNKETLYISCVPYTNYWGDWENTRRCYYKYTPLLFPILPTWATAARWS